jgi:hypothetical protein
LLGNVRNRKGTKLGYSVTHEIPKKPDTFFNDMMDIEVTIDKDKFYSYAHRSPTAIDDPKTFNPIKWWYEHQIFFSTLYLYTFDTLIIPVISAEYKRVFNSIKKLITPEKNRLTEEIIEASEYLKN